MQFTFPKDFIWGAGTSAHQVEGNNINSDYWLYEHLPETIFAEPSMDACDHYHRYEQDIAILAGLGLNSYRFSIEWARVEPEEGYFSQAEIEHYRRMLLACHKHGLQPIVTMFHHTLPRWMMSLGSWESDKMPALFARFCGHVTEQLGDLMSIVCTLNEPNINLKLARIQQIPTLAEIRQQPWAKAASHALGITPSQFAPFFYADSEKARDILIQSHKLATEVMKSKSNKLSIGLTLALDPVHARNGGEAVAKRIIDECHNVYLEAIKGDDFLGLQCYSRRLAGPDGMLPIPEDAETTDMGWEFYPETLEDAIRDSAKIANIPMLVTENGVAATDDSRRVEYIQRALAGVALCINDGYNVMGYLYWSAFDNFEWSFGFAPRFGIIGVNHQTQERTVRESAKYLGRIAQKNALTI